MIHVSGQFLFPAGITRLGKPATKIAPNDSATFSYLLYRPLQICDRETAVLPVRDRLFRNEAIHVNCDINRTPLDRTNEFLKMLPPIIAEDRAAPLLIFACAIVRPRMDFQTAGSLSSTISENLL